VIPQPRESSHVRSILDELQHIRYKDLYGIIFRDMSPMLQTAASPQPCECNPCMIRVNLDIAFCGSQCILKVYSSLCEHVSGEGPRQIRVQLHLPRFPAPRNTMLSTRRNIGARRCLHEQHSQCNDRNTETHQDGICIGRRLGSCTVESTRRKMLSQQQMQAPPILSAAYRHVR